MNTSKILDGPSFSCHNNPKKLIFMLHGYGDNAENFIKITNPFDIKSWKINYYSLNASSLVNQLPNGRQWFELYPNGIHIADAGPNEINIIKQQILDSIKLIENTINKIRQYFNLNHEDCFLLGFSQGGMMAFEYANFVKKSLAGLVILSGRVLTEEKITNQAFLKTPIFISHGVNDKVLPIKFFNTACKNLSKNNMIFESHEIQNDAHTISYETLELLQKFIKKNL